MCENKSRRGYYGTGMAPYLYRSTYMAHIHLRTSSIHVALRDYNLQYISKPEPRTNTAANIFSKPVSIVSPLRPKSCVRHVPQPLTPESTVHTQRLRVMKCSSQPASQ